MMTTIGNGAVIEDSVIMGLTFYQSLNSQSTSEDSKNMEGTSIPIGIGEDTRIKKAIIDKNVVIMNKDNAQEGDREASGYVIREGIVVVLQSAVIPDGTIL